VGYAQQITRIYEIGSDLTYFIAGRVQGNLTIGRIVGPGVIMNAFYNKFGNVCNAAENTMNFIIGTGCNPRGGASADFTNAKYKINYVVITNVGINVGAQDMVINEQIQMMFVSMENQGGGIAGVAGLAGGGAGLGGGGAGGGLGGGAGLVGIGAGGAIGGGGGIGNTGVGIGGTAGLAAAGGPGGGGIAA
jgi:hypothetical protein